MGTYGFSRFLFIFGWRRLNLFWVLSFFGVVIVRVFCCFLGDAKALVAYSSVSHMNLLLLSFLGGSSMGKGAVVLLMVSHGLVSIFLFYLIGELYSYWGTRVVYHLSGLGVVFFSLSFLVIVGFMANSGIPPFLGLFSEIYCIGVLWGLSPYFVLFLGVYFFFTLYYCILLSINIVSGFSLMGVSSFIFYGGLSLFMGVFVVIL